MMIVLRVSGVAMTEIKPTRLRGLRCHSIAIAAVLALSGCATRVPIERLVADAGVRSTRALAIDVDNFAGRLEEGDAIAAFVATWRACEAGPGRCVVTAPGELERAQRQELAEAVALRRDAVLALSGAYSAFRAELSHQSNADAERAINAALLGTATYATTMAGAPLVRTAVVGRPLEHLVGSVGASLNGERRRLETRRASRDLGEAIKELREAMTLETRKYDALAEVLVGQRTDAHRAMIQAGLISGAGTLRPFADRMNVPLARDADMIVARTPAARTSLEAMIEANERQEVRRTQMRYRAAIATLQELENVHAALDRGERPQLEDLERAIWRLERLSETLITPSRALGAPLTEQPPQ
jgi:hypothetical protein